MKFKTGLIFVLSVLLICLTLAACAKPRLNHEAKPEEPDVVLTKITVGDITYQDLGDQLHVGAVNGNCTVNTAVLVKQNALAALVDHHGVARDLHDGTVALVLQVYQVTLGVGSYVVVTAVDIDVAVSNLPSVAVAVGDVW